ncbi:MAG: hypothetical protein KME57_31755 [Scytonema hyalinum WJT4-NPBG1]|nr:hypothetical protein [Scytonema hyalinum WJT4-NPBG1]
MAIYPYFQAEIQSQHCLYSCLYIKVVQALVTQSQVSTRTRKTNYQQFHKRIFPTRGKEPTQREVKSNE